MATIILEPGEIFEHTHDADTHTELVQGKLTLRVGAEEREMIPNEQVLIRAHQGHAIVNTGSVEAVVRCSYC